MQVLMLGAWCASVVCLSLSSQEPAPAPNPLLMSITLDQQNFARSEKISGKVVLNHGHNTDGTLGFTWSDSFGRNIAQFEKSIKAGQVQAAFECIAAPALTYANTLKVQFVAGEEKLETTSEFIVTPDYEPWDDYKVIMYYAYKPEQQPHLRDLGINAGMNQGRGRLLDPSRINTRIWWSYGYPYYAEQILADVYAEYHRYHENADKNIELKKAKEIYKQDKSKKDAFIRKPCFADPDVRKKIEDVMTKAVEVNKPLAPLFYSLADEAGVADLPSAWDFCYDPRTLVQMREWLKTQYKTLDALNAEWETKFATWDDVVPLTTDEMMKRGGDNLSPWADHRTFMEISFAEAVKWGCDAVHKADPKAYVGLVGCQMPSAFGGYDYWRLSQIMNVIEPYNIGNNREIWRSFSPHTPAVTTSFGFSNQEVWRLWYQLLHGDRGIIIYDEKNTYLDDKGTPTELGKQVSGPYHELTAGICKLLSNCVRVNDPIAIHYSQASIHAHWMFQARPDGEKWIERGSASERLKSDFLRLRESFTKLIEDQGLQYAFVSYEQLEKGELAKNPPKVLFLPQSIAMSSTECEAVRAFVEAGGTVVADSRCALMDEHCKRLPKGQLDDLFGVARDSQDWEQCEKGLTPTEKGKEFLARPGLLKLAVPEIGLKVVEGSDAQAFLKDGHNVAAFVMRKAGKGSAIYLNIDITDYHRWRLKAGEDADARRLFSEILKIAGVAPTYAVTGPGGAFVPGVEVHPFENGDAKVVALHRNPQLRINELGPPEYQSNALFEKPEDLQVDLGAAYAVYDVRAGKLLAEHEQMLSVKLDPFLPTILALFKAPVKAVKLDAPGKNKRGETLEYKVKLDAPAPAAVHVYRFEVSGPDGKEMPLYSRNLKAPKGVFEGVVYLALNDPAGVYTLTVRDLSTGLTAKQTVNVE